MNYDPVMILVSDPRRTPATPDPGYTPGGDAADPDRGVGSTVSIREKIKDQN